jgi:ABC-2 type transport system permease protein
MSTTVAEPGVIDFSQTAPVPFSRLVSVEVRKATDTRAGFWLLASMGLLTLAIFIGQLITGAVSDKQHLQFGSFTTGAAIGTGILLPVLGILLITSEWSQRTAMTTFVLEPHRSRSILAKLVAGLLLALVVTVFVVVAGAVANLVNGAIDGGADWGGFGVKGVIGFVLAQSLGMLSGFALAALILNTPAAIVAYFVYAFVVPTIIAILSSLSSSIESALKWFDFQNAQAPLYDLSFNSGTEVGRFVVSGVIWLVLPLAFGLWRVLRAEVK